MLARQLKAIWKKINFLKQNKKCKRKTTVRYTVVFLSYEVTLSADGSVSSDLTSSYDLFRDVHRFFRVFCVEIGVYLLGVLGGEHRSAYHYLAWHVIFVEKLYRLFH